MNIIITGVTGSGKNVLSMQLIKFLRKNYQLEAEIINADSIQIYNDLKIIANHPTEADFAAVPHHLYEILSPYEKASVTFWLEQATKTIHYLNKQHKIAIICGGTGFYIDALLHQISDIPPIPQEIRETVHKHFEAIGREKFFQELCKLDPKLTKKLHPNNTQRILRAYEVVSYTGKPLSSWWENSKNCENLEKNKINQVVCESFVLLPERNQLKNVVIERTKKMLAAGAIEEISTFIKKFPNYIGPLCKTIGFQEIIQQINGEINFDQCIEKISIKTMQYAKRQSTWFRNKLPEATIFLNFGNAGHVIEKISERLCAHF